MLLLSIGTAHLASAQSIAAGQHQSGQYYVDIQPDTTIVAPNALPVTQATLPLDLNGDGVADFELRVYNNNGVGIKVRSCYLEPKNGNEIAVAYADSCLSTDCGYTGLVWDYGMARAYEYGETIGAGAQWADSLVYLAYDRFSGGCFACSDNTFTDTSDAYVGVRIFTAADTVYGWIKVSDVSNISCTVETLAGESELSSTAEQLPGNISVQVYPNPASGQFRYDFSAPLPAPSVLLMWDNTARPVYQAEMAAGIRMFVPEAAQLQAGIYYYSIRSAGGMASGKLVVQR
jgi:hypothetical protein